MGTNYCFVEGDSGGACRQNLNIGSYLPWTDQFNLFKPGETDYAQNITTGPPQIQKAIYTAVRGTELKISLILSLVKRPTKDRIISKKSSFETKTY